MRFILDLVPEDDDTDYVHKLFDGLLAGCDPGLPMKITDRDGDVAHVCVTRTGTHGGPHGDDYRPTLAGWSYDNDDYYGEKSPWWLATDDIREVVVW